MQKRWKLLPKKSEATDAAVEAAPQAETPAVAEKAAPEAPAKETKEEKKD